MIQFSTSYFKASYAMADGEIQCRRVTQILSDFIEGELSDTERQSVEAHLDQCANCRQARDELLLTIALLKRLPKHVPPAVPNPKHSSDENS